LDNPSVYNLLNIKLSPVLLAAYPSGSAVLVIAILILLTISFFVSGAEVAFFSLTYKDMNMLKTKQHPAARRIVHLLEQPKNLLATMLIANSFVNIGIIIMSNLLLDPFTRNMVIGGFGVGLIVKILIVTATLILFGEVLPKVWATQNNIRFAYSASWLMEGLYYLFKKLSRWLVGYSDIIERKFARKNSGSYSLEELDHAIDLTTKNDATEEEKNILKGIVKFGNITVKQIMRTRMDVSGINFDMPFDELVRKVEELHYSRLPVYKNSLDEVAGTIHTKDLLPYINEPANFNWHPLMRQTYFVHEQKLIEDLLKEFQSKRIHFAVVVDEFGGTSGIVTLEDIMEEIIGDIKDEFDDEESVNKKIDDNTYIFEGKTMINDVCKVMNLSADTFDQMKGESDSLAGLLLEIVGEFPQLNAVIPCGDFEFTVMEINKNRLQKIKVVINLAS
jgi:putative hemolysin